MCPGIGRIPACLPIVSSGGAVHIWKAATKLKRTADSCRSIGVIQRDPAAFNAGAVIVNTDNVHSYSVHVEMLDWGVQQVWSNPVRMPLWNPDVTIGPHTTQTFGWLITQSVAQPGLALTQYEIRITLPEESHLIINCVAVDSTTKNISGKFGATQATGRNQSLTVEVSISGTSARSGRPEYSAAPSRLASGTRTSATVSAIAA